MQRTNPITTWKNNVLYERQVLAWFLQFPLKKYFWESYQLHHCTGGTSLMLSEAKMLLVDGDEGIRKSLSLFFGARNYHLHTAENAAQALFAVKQVAYDIILCDELLPDMNGLVFFKILNSRCYRAIKILISLYGNNTTFENIQGKGIDYLLTKPFSGDEVEATLLRLIKYKYSKEGRTAGEDLNLGNKK